MNQCAQNPCQNGGTCVNYGTQGFVCQCRFGCTGQTCSNCKRNPLFHNMTREALRLQKFLLFIALFLQRINNKENLK